MAFFNSRIFLFLKIGQTKFGFFGLFCTVQFSCWFGRFKDNFRRFWIPTDFCTLFLDTEGYIFFLNSSLEFYNF